MSVPSDLASAIVSLQSVSSGITERLAALRFVHQHVDNARVQLEPALRRRLNQLLYDNILYFMTTIDDRTSDLRRRQIIKTEMFLMLAKLLNSKTLFSEVHERISEEDTVPNIIDADGMTAITDSNSNSPMPYSVESPASNSSSVNSPLNSPMQVKVGKNISNKIPKSPGPLLSPPGGWVNSPDKMELPSDELTKLSKRLSKQLSKSPNRNSLDQLPLSPASQQSILSPGPSVSTISNSPTVYRSADIVDSKSAASLTLLRPVIQKSIRSIQKHKFKSRTATFFNDKFDSDNLVPGVSGTNWIEQDKRLGYQMPRVWFPFDMVNNKGSMIPAPRDQIAKEGSLTSDKVVEEYLAMKSLISYIGDLVAPYKKRTESIESRLETLGKNVKGVTDEQRFMESLKEITTVYAPLLGPLLPKWARDKLHNTLPKKHRVSITAADDNDSSEVIMPGADFDMESVSPIKADRMYNIMHSPSPYVQSSNNQPQEEEKGASDTAKSVLLTKGVLRSLLKKQIQFSNKSKLNLRDALDKLVQDGGNSGVDRTAFSNYQELYAQSLQQEQENVQSTLSTINTLMYETVQLQYEMLPPRYLLILEGSKQNNPRTVLLRGMHTYCRERRLSFMKLALGIWKIQLILQEIKKRRPVYQKSFSIQLLFGSFRRMLLRAYIRSFGTWKQKVIRAIFDERCKYIIRVQTAYRMMRDRNKMILLNSIAPYNGPLSDIYLAPQRDVKFTIPVRVRAYRRMIWYATVSIQSHRRMYVQYNGYRKKKRQVLMLQTYGRMCPIRSRYKLLRNATIRSQANARRVIKRNFFYVLKYYSRIIQRRVRVYLAQCLRERLANSLYMVFQRRLYSAIKLQCRWRIMKATRRCSKIRLYKAKRLWASLFMAKNWYRMNNQFHTFVLMSAYRARELEDNEHYQLVKDTTKKLMAKRIQHFYKNEFTSNYINHVITAQCWFRFHFAINNLPVIRKRKWAGRKVRNWLKVMHRRRCKAARKIQNLWWNYTLLKQFDKKGALTNRIKHLRYHARRKEVHLQVSRNDARYKAAARIQGVVKGVLCRSWLFKNKCASIMQRPIRFFLARKRWKREKREQIYGGIIKYIKNLTKNAMLKRTIMLVDYHSSLMKRPQSLVRGFLLRCKFYRAKQYAYKFGLCVVLIQRKWRNRKAACAAIKEINSIRRMAKNPFRDCVDLASLFNAYRKPEYSLKYYSLRDPRAGLRVAEMMYRLGRPELTSMFVLTGQPNYYKTLNDLSGITMKKLYNLYDLYVQRTGNFSASTEKSNTKKDLKAKEPTTYPEKLFQTILQLLALPPHSKSTADLELLRSISPVQEVTSAVELYEYVVTKFNNKFGTNYQSRGVNIANYVVDHCYHKYSSYKSIIKVMTKAQIDYCMDVTSSSDSARVKDVLYAIHDKEECYKSIYTGSSTNAVNTKKYAEDNAWDVDRAIKAFHTMQLFLDQLYYIEQKYNKSKILQYIEADSMTKLDFYNKRYAYLQLNPPDASGNEEEKEITNGTSTVHRLDPLKIAQLTYKGPKQYKELDHTLTKLRFLDHTINALYRVYSAVKTIKIMWLKKHLVAIIRKNRIGILLDIKKQEYLQMITENHVVRVWEKDRRIEMVNTRIQAIINDTKVKREITEKSLQNIPRFGYILIDDDDGVPLWADKFLRKESSYIMPIYNFDEYKAVMAIQRIAKHFLTHLAEHRARKQAQKEAELQLLRAKREQELIASSKHLKFSINMVDKDVPKLLLHGLPANPEYPECESSLPFKLRLTVKPIFATGTWCLLSKLSPAYIRQHPVKEIVITNPFNIANIAVTPGSSRGKVGSKFGSSKSPDRSQDKSVRAVTPGKATTPGKESVKGSPAGLTSKKSKPADSIERAITPVAPLNDTSTKDNVLSAFMEDDSTVTKLEMVVIFNLRPDPANCENRICDAKDAKGVRYTDVSLADLYQMNLDKGDYVEARFELQVHLYRGVIDKINKVAGFADTYDITYDDGQTEYNIPRELIRPSPALLNSFLNNRRVATQDYCAVKRRKEHYAAMRTERLKSTIESASWNEQQFMEKWHLVDDAENVRKVWPKDTPRPAAGSLFFNMMNSIKNVSKLLPSVQASLLYTRLPLKYGWISQRVDKTSLIFKNIISKATAASFQAYSIQQEFAARRIQSQWKVRMAKISMRTMLFSQSIDEICVNAIKDYTKIGTIGYKDEGVTSMQLLRRAGYWDLANIIENYYRIHYSNNSDPAKNRPITSVTLSYLARLSEDSFKELGIKEFDAVSRLKDLQLWHKRTPLAKREQSLAYFNYYNYRGGMVNDNRTLAKCLQDSEDLIYNKFIKLFTAGASRTRTAINNFLSTSLYPHTMAMFDVYLAKYSENAELVRSMLKELAVVPSLCTYIDERRIYDLLYNSCLRISIMLGKLGLKSVRDKCTAIINENHIELQKTLNRLNKKGEERVKAPGPEGKAALTLRADVLEFYMRIYRAACVLKAKLRGYTKRQWFVKTRFIRLTSCLVLQRISRGLHDRITARKLREQQNAEWEQLWDDKRNILYYYNRYTNESKFVEPKAGTMYRPLVRDRRSSRLMQSWPHINTSDGNKRSLSLESIQETTGDTCNVCAVRKCTRYCWDCKGTASGPFLYCFPCYNKEHAGDIQKESHRSEDPRKKNCKRDTQATTEQAAPKPTGVAYYGYDDNNNIDAEFAGINGNEESKLVAPAPFDFVATTSRPGTSASTYLRCVSCNYAATRKCQGILDDDELGALMYLLKNSSTTNWSAILRDHHIAGDKKLRLLLDTISSEFGHATVQTGGKSKGVTLMDYAPSADQLQQAHTILLRARAECDDNYCDYCYGTVHSSGKRALHKWIGYESQAVVCTVCTNSPAQVSCLDCGTEGIFCGSCFNALHAKGKKQRHRHEKLMEALIASDTVCVVCERRKGTTTCPNHTCKFYGDFLGCNSCYECKHKPTCDETAAIMKESAANSEYKRSQVMDKNIAKLIKEYEGRVCTGCGEMADTKCEQCNDYYCSRSWMGFDGCFNQYHSKGFRAVHKIVQLPEVPDYVRLLIAQHKHGSGN